jgi:glycosyltransferase involved in cell wall biosynthesis
VQIVIIEPLLKDKSGHQFSYTIALQSELEKRGLNVSILGNSSADESCLSIRNFYPCLSDITSRVFKMSSTPRSLYHIYKLIKLLRNQLENFFININNFMNQRENILFLHSLYIFELLSVGWFFKRWRRIFCKNNHKILIGFNFSYKRSSLFSTIIMVLLYKYVFTFLVKGLHSQIVYFSDGELLRREYERIFNEKVHLLPVPINNLFSNIYINNPKQNINVGRKIAVSYVGGARYNKGFDIFVKMVINLLAKEDISERIILFVQIDIHRQQSNRDKKEILKSSQVLKTLADRFKNIKLIYGALSVEEYYKLLSESDIIILPYREESFKFVPSQIFRETLLFGKVPLVSKNTTMSFELARYNLADLTFNIKSIESLVNTIKRVINNIDKYQIKIRSIQREYANFYSAINLVNSILALVS